MGGGSLLFFFVLADLFTSFVSCCEPRSQCRMQSRAVVRDGGNSCLIWGSFLGCGNTNQKVN